MSNTRHPAGKVIAHLYVFASDSSDAEYQTLQYADGSMSCACMGWTRRVDAAGNRSCKHTRYVDCGMARSRCVRFKDYAEVETPAPRFVPAAPRVNKPSAGRVFDLSGEETQ